MFGDYITHLTLSEKVKNVTHFARVWTKMPGHC